MSSDRQTVAACVFSGHDRHDCPLVQVLARRLLDSDIARAPGRIEHEVCKYRTVARVLACPMLGALFGSGGDAPA